MSAAAGQPCVVSVAEHAGWAHVVGVAAPGRSPEVVVRRRIQTIEPGLPTQPYHHDTLGMAAGAADVLVARVRRSIDAATSAALADVMTALAPVYDVVALTVRCPPFPDLPETIAEVRRSYPLQCAADGMLYQRAVCDAARRLGVALHQYPRGDAAVWAAEQLKATPDDVRAFVGGPGRPAGPPWTDEHRRAYTAGCVALAQYLPSPFSFEPS